MVRDTHRSTRVERLAASLRDNLRRRKAQARARQAGSAAGQSTIAPLSNPPGKS